MDDKKRLMEVPIEYLWDGLILKDDVYNPEGTVLLIPKGEKITEKKIEQLAHFGTRNRCVATYEESYQVILEGKEESENVRQAILENETGYTDLRRSVGRLLEISHTASQVERSEIEPVIANVVSSMKTMELKDVFACIHVPRPLDEKLQRHLLNVAFLNGMLGRWMQLSEQEIETLVMIGILHDVGKTKIPQEILDAPRKLTDEEYQIMKKHSLYSYQLLSNQFDSEIKEAVLHHHERVDGSGYPMGQKGEEIGLFARITAISDVYDAMVSERCYKTSISPFEILERIKNAEFEGLDVDLVAIFVKHMVKYYRYKDVKMSDGRDGKVMYIPPNDISHPIIRVGRFVKQTVDTWYPVRME